MTVLEEIKVCRMLEGLFQFGKECEWNDAIEEAMHRFVNLPTIDAVEVVRCRDCKWWNGYYRECESPNWNTGTEEYIVQPAGMFCGWGERRDDADESVCT